MRPAGELGGPPAGRMGHSVQGILLFLLLCFARFSLLPGRPVNRPTGPIGQGNRITVPHRNSSRGPCLGQVNTRMILVAFVRVHGGEESWPPLPLSRCTAASAICTTADANIFACTASGISSP